MAMKLSTCTLLGLVPWSMASSSTPVQQVLNMLGNMKAKGKHGLESEQKVYADYKEWVSDRTKELGFEIQTAESNIEKFIAFIDEADNKVAQLADAIAALDGTIGQLEDEQKSATSIRDSERSDYVELSQDLSESVDALERAIQTVSEQSYDRPQAEMLLQRMAKTAPAMRRVLAAFLQTSGQQARGDGAPDVAAYEFQSEGIADLLQGLLKKFRDELSETQKDESNRQHRFDLEILQLSDTITHTKSDRDEKATRRAMIEGQSAQAKGELAETKTGLFDDQKLLKDVKASFETKSSTFHANQQIRKNELEALSKAVEVLSNPEVAESYATHINLAEVKHEVSFLQMRRHTHRVNARKHVQEHAIKLLQKRAAALSSKSLTALVANVQGNPFEKVIGMVKDLLEKLKAEAAAESSHKAWCDEQLHANKLKREKKTSEVNQLTAEIQELAGKIDTMGTDISTLAQEQADLSKAMADATSQRNKENAGNVATIADAKAGAAAVKQAITILEEFYAQHATSLLQHAGTKQEPSMTAYKGMQNTKGGVVGMLEVIETDFMRLDSETATSEATALASYNKFMLEAQASVKSKHEDEVKLRLDKDKAEFEKDQLKKDLGASDHELDMANLYFDDLKPVCVEVHVSFEERASRRKEELAALNEAYSILDSKGA